MICMLQGCDGSFDTDFKQTNKTKNWSDNVTKWTQICHLFWLLLPQMKPVQTDVLQIHPITTRSLSPPLSRHKEAYHQKWKLQKCSVFLTNWRWWLVWKLPPPSAVGKHTEHITSDWGRWRVCFQGTRKLNSTQKYKLQTDPSNDSRVCCSVVQLTVSRVQQAAQYLVFSRSRQDNRLMEERINKERKEFQTFLQGC